MIVIIGCLGVLVEEQRTVDRNLYHPTVKKERIVRKSSHFFNLIFNCVCTSCVIAIKVTKANTATSANTILSVKTVNRDQLFQKSFARFEGTLSVVKVVVIMASLHFALKLQQPQVKPWIPPY